MMRTIRRRTEKLNEGKWSFLCDIARRYSKEKQAHLQYFTDARFALQTERTRRDELVDAGYISQYKLQARMWKLALKDAYEIIVKQWASLKVEISPLISRQDKWTDAEKHYANWLIYTPRRMALLCSGLAPIPNSFKIPHQSLSKVRNYLRRVIRRMKGARPKVKKARSFALDKEMYETFEEKGTQYIKVMSLEKGKRIVIPLLGNTPILGNIRLVLEKEFKRVEIHYTAEIKPKSRSDRDEPCSLDAGVSEVFTDEQGNRYGTDFGTFIKESSDETTDLSKKRNKLFSLYKKAENKGDEAKAKRIRKFNLGNHKQFQTGLKRKAEMERQINFSLNQVIAKRVPSMIVTEKLDLRGKAKSKSLSRRVSLWARKIIKERIEFKASAGGSRREQVNPAYSSQTCPSCGFVHKENRQSDKFQCLHCGHAGSADQVAAINLLSRLADPEIHLYTPRERVKAILMQRFNARLERANVENIACDVTDVPPTVSGRTPETSRLRVSSSPDSRDEDTDLSGISRFSGSPVFGIPSERDRQSGTCGRGLSRLNHNVNRRAKRPAEFFWVGENAGAICRQA